MDIADFKNLDFTAPPQDAPEDLSHTATTFSNAVKGYAQYVQEHADVKAKDTQNKVIRKALVDFFAHAVHWTTLERKKHQKVKDIPEATDLKKSAAAAIKDVQNNIIEFCICYADIGRSMGLVQKDLQDYKDKTSAPKDFKWTSDTGDVLKRFQKERQHLIKSNARLTQGERVLEQADVYWQNTESLMAKFMSADNVTTTTRTLKSALRNTDFKKAQQIIGALENQKKKFALDKKNEQQTIQDLQKNAALYIKYLDEALDDITMQDGKIFLSPNEVAVVINSQEREIEQKNTYIDKYHLPYMENKHKSLSNLRDKLLIVGSIESLITLYMKLMRGLANPMNDLKKLREYESKVVENVNFLRTGQFKEIARIDKRKDDMMTEFYETMDDFLANPVQSPSPDKHNEAIA